MAKNAFTKQTLPISFTQPEKTFPKKGFKKKLYGKKAKSWKIRYGKKSKSSLNQSLQWPKNMAKKHISKTNFSHVIHAAGKNISQEKAFQKNIRQKKSFVKQTLQQPKKIYRKRFSKTNSSAGQKKISETKSSTSSIAGRKNVTFSAEVLANRCTIKWMQSI